MPREHSSARFLASTYSPIALATHTNQSRDRTPSSSRSSFSWFRDFRRLDDKFVLRHSSMEAYLFLRYLRMVVLICVVGCCLTWPVLFAINATGGGGASEADKISFGNVLDSKKLYAHAIVAWIFFGESPCSSKRTDC